MSEKNKAVSAHDDDYLRAGDQRDPDFADAPKPTAEPLSTLRLAGLLLGPAAAIAIMFSAPPEGMPPAA